MKKTILVLLLAILLLFGWVLAGCIPLNGSNNGDYGLGTDHSTISGGNEVVIEAIKYTKSFEVIRNETTGETVVGMTGETFSTHANSDFTLIIWESTANFPYYVEAVAKGDILVPPAHVLPHKPENMYGTYTFKGWNTENPWQSYGGEVVNNVVAGGHSMRMYPVFDQTLSTYTINFAFGVQTEMETTLPETFTGTWYEMQDDMDKHVYDAMEWPEGYYFYGWYTDPECTERFSHWNPDSKDLTLYCYLSTTQPEDPGMTCIV
jgi:hypothetical protein